MGVSAPTTEVDEEWEISAPRAEVDEEWEISALVTK